MIRNQKLIRMILGKRPNKYGRVFSQRGTHKTLRRPIKFAGLLWAQLQTQNAGASGKDTPAQPPEDIQVPEGND